MRVRPSGLALLLPLLALACDGGRTGPTEHPAPSITAVTPSVLPAGGAAQTLAVEGTGFVAASVVHWNDRPRPTTFVSGTRVTALIDAADLAEAGRPIVTVLTPAPGGGRSNAVTALVEWARNPVPSIAAISEPSIVAGSDGRTVMVDGTGFVATSVVHVDGAARPTLLLAPTRLGVYITDDDLAAPGSRALTVANPEPGGGISGPVGLAVVADVPVLVGAASRGGAVGSPSFWLPIDGERFARGAVVRWNGSNRPTIFRSGRRLLVQLGAADLAVPGVASLTVHNPAVEVPSAGVAFSVRPVGPAVITSAIALDLSVGEVVHDSVSGLLYASVRATSANHPASVVAVAPETGRIVASVPVGEDPRWLALSDDGSVLYVSEARNGTIRRLRLPSLQQDLEFQLGQSRVPWQMLVVPGAPSSVVIARRSTAYSPSDLGVAVFVDGVARSGTVGGVGNNSLAFDGRSSSRLYGIGWQTDDFSLEILTLHDGGIQGGDRIDLPYTGLLRGAEGRIYSSHGTIIDPAAATPIVGDAAPSAHGGAWSVTPDAELGRLFFFANEHIEVIDMNLPRPLGVLTAPGFVNEHPFEAGIYLVRWGDDGLAYRDESRLHIIRTPLAAR